MKKLMALILVFFAIAFNAQDLQAQQKPEDIAKLKVAELTEKLELTGDQQRAMWRVFVKKESAYAKQVNNQDASDASVVAAKQEIDATLDKEVKAILSPKQYELYSKEVEK
jgi:ribosomal protein S20